ncbi:DivIVA domain-containing protein [Citricoccus zhacaiensis]|uniref:DivIVA domain-containing protein n=1 Tax=Citricoccus zhacaiensis TaxID=489142 RepID=A0ABQ2LN91_9MICC|nr:DivIVA domain-containing protein [Citricoccus zhacaiensis]GGO40676.1 DivIVA domain-containing protein [Citricoccus zhacaiensis]
MDHGTRQDSEGLQQQVMRSADRQPFDLADRRTFGYHRKQVDRFLARARVAYEGGGDLRSADIRHITFDAVKGGYRADQVDDVLDRLEDALARSERERRIEVEGEEAWMNRVHASIDVLRGRLDRPDGERFRRPARDRDGGYDRAEVDALCHRLSARFDDRTEGADLGADDLRRVVFAAAPGTDGYDEAQVDAFLDAAIDVLSILD